jgi:hypothetical protein
VCEQCLIAITTVIGWLLVMIKLNDVQDFANPSFELSAHYKLVASSAVFAFTSLHAHREHSY